jgi:hypothetical protein
MLLIAAVVNQLPGTSIMYRVAGGIASDLLNTMPVDFAAGSYTEFGREYAFRMDDPSMSRHGEAGELDFTESEKPYLTKPYAKKAAIPFDIQAMTATRVNRLQMITRALTEVLDKWREKQTYTLVDSFTKDAVGTSWAQDAADPIKDAKTLAQKLAMAPNVAVIGKRVVDRLCYHPKVLALRNTAAAGSVSLADLANMLEVDKILVPTMKVNTAVKGRAENLDYLWGDVFWMGYRSPNQQIGTEEISFGAQIALNMPAPVAPRTTSQVLSASQDGTLVRVWEEESRGVAGSAMVQVARQYEIKKIAADLGRGLSGVLA